MNCRLSADVEFSNFDFSFFKGYRILHSSLFVLHLKEAIEFFTLRSSLFTSQGVSPFLPLKCCQHFLNIFSILVQLLFKSLNTVKALLVAQSKTEGDGHGLTVDVVIEIEDVSLNGGG